MTRFETKELYKNMVDRKLLHTERDLERRKEIIRLIMRQQNCDVRTALEQHRIQLQEKHGGPLPARIAAELEEILKNGLDPLDSVCEPHK
jgi:3-isopropylmalate dehydratase small subunit